ncbi:tellurite resistance protein TerA [Geodermatophilus amargosae]|uniref:Tellurite resistance protein TerA n=1 Tax=Geodermatophilus amargosae TaxID=1296565 RepID=A0A1I6ZX33_9ACTN|nr:Tellurium resistance [Geodermatophilus amargosae]SFT67233.1 tellurite resistance protein TerA [Geodermatophilus amargosae]
MIDYTRPPKQKPGGVSLGKVTLTKAAPSVSLSKAQGARGQMRVNLNWTQRPGRGFLGKREAVDLDLGCLWETTDGDKGVVQALGNSFGDLDWPPYALLDGDDRSGANSGGENLIVNLDHLDEIRRVLVFAYIYDGAPNWAAADGVVTLHLVDGGEITVKLDDHAQDTRFCAIAMLTNQRGQLHVQREIRYLHGDQEDLDRAYGWGLRWKAARK